jgi:cytohesin
MPAKDSQLDAFRDAIRNHDRQKVEEFLAQGVDLTAQIFVGHTALTLAANAGDQEIVKLLLDAGADINGRGKDNLTALHAATSEGEPGMIRLLISRRADLNASMTGLSRNGHRPLHDAAYSQNIRAMRELIAAGADVNAMSEGDRTPLHMALLRGGKKNLEMVQLLVEAGSDVNASDRPPLFDACRGGNVEIVQALIDAGANVNATNDVGESVLACAVYDGDVDVIQLLLDRGADPDYRLPSKHGDWPNMTALDVAKTEKKPKIVKLLEGTGPPRATETKTTAKPKKSKSSKK